MRRGAWTQPDEPLVRSCRWWRTLRRIRRLSEVAVWLAQRPEAATAAAGGSGGEAARQGGRSLRGRSHRGPSYVDGQAGLVSMR